MDEGLFDNPLGGLDLSELSFTGGTTEIPEEGSEEMEDIVDPGTGVTDTNAEADLEDGLDDKAQRSADLHQGRGFLGKDDDIPLEEETVEPELNVFQAFAEEGIISLGDDEEIPEDADLEWFAGKAREQVQADVDSAIADYKDTLPEEVKYLLDNHDAGVTIQDLLKADKKVTDMSSITVENIEDSEKTQKDLVSKYLALTGESAEDIKDTLMDYEDSGLLTKMAKRAHSKLVSHESSERERIVTEKKASEVQRQSDYKGWLSDLKTNIDKKDEIIPGVALTDKQRKELYKGITQVDKNGKNAVARYRDSNPDFDLQMAYLATVLKGDFSALEDAASTKATRALKEKANSMSSSSAKNGKKLKGVDINIMTKALKFK